MNIKKKIGDLKNMFETKRELIFFILITILFINLGLLIIFQGITLNDEVIMYERRMDGWFSLVIRGIKGEILQGRLLRSMAAINVAITNITTSIYFNRFIQVIILGILFYLAYKLILKLFNKRTSNIWLFISLSSFPILFEHGVPSAYNGLTLIPFLELVLSIHFWLQYLNDNKKKWHILSIICWIISLCGYEFIVTYTPVFVLMYLFEKYKKNKPIVLECIKKCFWHCLSGILYIALTFVLQKVINVTYDGVAMNLTDFSKVINVIYVMVVSSIPGAYLVNDKYKYLINMYKTDISFIHTFMIFPIILLLMYFCSILVSKNKFKEENSEEKHNWLRIFLIIICLISYLAIPILPNSITLMYQELVSFESFSWFPVSIFTFFTSCLLFSYVISIIMKKRYKVGILLLIAYVLFIAIPVQHMNIVIGNKTMNNYKIIYSTKNMLNTETIKKLNNVDFISEDIFETKDLLAIHDSFWNNIAKSTNLNISFRKYDENIKLNNKEKNFWVSFMDNEYFCISNEREAAILSKKSLKGQKILETFKDEYEIVKTENGFYDNGYYVYRYIKEDNKWISSNNAADTFKIYSVEAGTDKEGIIEIYGVEDDYWINKKSEFMIKSLEKGIIKIDVYFPTYNKNNKYYLTISINDQKEKKYFLSSERTTIELKTSAHNDNIIKVNSNFLIEKNNNDSRELSWYLSDIQGY